MDVVSAVSGYVSKMVSAGDPLAQGTSSAKMKILLLDSETVGHAIREITCRPPANSIEGPHRLNSHHPVRASQP